MRNLVYRRATLPRGMADEGRFLDEQIVTAGESMLTFSSHTRFRDAMLGGSDWLHVTESARAAGYIFSKQVQKACSFWLLTRWLLTFPSHLYVASKIVLHVYTFLYTP